MAKNPDWAHKEILEHFHYDPDNGVVRILKIRSYHHSVGDIVGYPYALGYVGIKFRQHKVYMHRFVWFYMTGGWPQHEVDHINGSRDDNRWANLRLATSSENKSNAKARSHRTGYGRGIYYEPRNTYRRWVTKVVFQNKAYVQSFETLDEAKAHTKALREKLHGEYARHN